MNKMRSAKKNQKAFFILLAVVCALTVFFAAAFISSAADNETEFIYFDLSAGNVSINGTSYTGYVYQKSGGAFSKVTVSGTLEANQEYYVYQSVGGSSNPDGYFTLGEGGVKEFTIPERTPVKVNGRLWREYVTNNTNVNGVINDWITHSGRTGTSNYISVSGAVDCTLVIDNVYSTHAVAGTSRTTGGIGFHVNGFSAASSLTVKTVGDNRLNNIHFSTGGYNNKKLIIDEQEAGSSLTVADINTSGNFNFWNSAIGSTDSTDDSRGITIKGGTVFAGTTPSNDCTAIGAGGNGHGIVTIEGGVITAVTSSSGAAIGGGIGKTSKGGQATVTISGGEIYAYNFSCSSGGYSQQGVAYIPSAAIGGGSSARETCNSSTITITGGRVYAQSVGGTAIGGGSSADNHGGSSVVTISGNAYVEAKSIAGTISGEAVPAGVSIGGGTGGKASGKNGGDVTLSIGGSATLVAGSIGGGKTISTTGKIGAATVTVTGGDIQGQIIMAAGSSTKCTFTMSNGTIDNSLRDASFVFLEENGGAIYMDDPQGVAKLTGGTISGCVAKNGGALYMTDGSFALSGNGIITGCTAEEMGGAVYMGGGKLTVSGGTLAENQAIKGAGAYLADGTMEVSGGSVKKNSASVDGGGAYLAGGVFTVTGGTIFENTAKNGAAALVANGNVIIGGGIITENRAEQNGGAFSITNGNYSMTGGEISGNRAENGDGGAIYVSSSMDNSNIIIRSGKILGNNAGNSGGALGVYGQAGVKFTITIGSATSHVDRSDSHVCADDHSKDESCPIIEANVSQKSGGGIYLSGSYDAVMNMHCMIELDNKVGDGVSPSNFMKVEGGTLNITTLGSEGEEDYGKISINSSIHVTGGDVTISGSGSNPIFNEPITVDVDSKSGSDFNDDREGGNARTIQYFENFEFQGEISGQYTLIDFVSTEPHIVRANMYNISGYEVEGWILMQPDSNGNLVSTGKMFTAGDEVAEEGNLIFYAKWTVVGYTVVFTPGTDSYKGSMDPQDFAYTDSKPLTKNAFVNVGYVFVHWVDKNDSSKKYNDGETVGGLSNVHGTEITLVAVWEICKHTDMSVYTLTNTSSSVSRTCACQGYTETATISGFNTTYNGNAHPAKLTYDRKSLNGVSPAEKWSFTVNYSGKTFGNVDFAGTEAPVNAGEYKASVTVSVDVSIEAHILISKANQNPPNPPEYTTTKSGDGNKNIIKIKNPNDTTGFVLEYQFLWYEGSVLKKSDWISWDASDPPTQELSVLYTNYYVDVRYKETDNYNASITVRGNSVIIFTGNVTFDISSEKGMLRDEVISKQKDGITVTLSPLDDYYIYNITTAMSASIDGYVLPQYEYLVTSADLWTIWIHNVKDAESDVTVRIHFSGVEKVIKVNSSVEADRQFTDMKDNTKKEVTISSDSAYTAYFNVENFAHYENLLLKFNSALPIGTSVVMVDNTTRSYWSYVTEASVSSIPLSEFVRMGSANEKFKVGTRTSFSLQFAVDFSTCASLSTASSLEVSLSATVANPSGLSTVPAMPTSAEAKSSVVLIKVPTFSIEEVVTPTLTPLSNTLSYEFAQLSVAGAGASKWNGVNGILIVTPSVSAVLPPDARLQVKSGDSTKVYPFINGCFTVVLSEENVSEVVLTLISDMMPNENITFNFDVALAASAAGVKNSTSNLSLNIAPVSVEYTVTKTVMPAIHAEINGDLPEYNNGNISSVQFVVLVKDVPANNTVRAVLYSKNDKGEYLSTTQTMNVSIDGNQFAGKMDLSSLKDVMNQRIGSLSLMLRVEIVDLNGKVVNYAPIYFVLVDARQYANNP